MAARSDTQRTIEHVVEAIEAAEKREQPFYHLQLANVFPTDIYAQLLAAMPVNEDYRPIPAAPNPPAP